MSEKKSLRFWKKSPSEANIAVDQEEEGEVETKDVNIITLFVPFVKNYASTFGSTRGNVGKIPYPPRFYLPASTLQHTIALKLNHIGLLSVAADQPDPLNRFLYVLRYFFSVVSLTKFPYKPIIAMEGETSHHFVSHPDTSRTFCLAEEIVHDPPHCAFYISNPSKGVYHDGNVQLEPKFKKAHVRVHLGGYNKIILKHPGGLFEEVYENNVPDLMISLLRMHTELSGEAVVTCKTTGYSASIMFKEKPLFGGTKNAIVGVISLNGQELYHLDGTWDEVVYIADSTQQKTEFFNRKTVTKDLIETPPLEALPPSAGERIWTPLTTLLKNEDFEAAQKLKLEMNQKENAERAARAANNVQPTYFAKGASGWWELIDPSKLVSNAMQGQTLN